MSVFYRRWRPQTLGEVVGQEPVVRTLCHALETGRIAHAYLFSGPRGTGKTSTARILAKAVNCTTTGGRGEPCNNCSLCQSISEGRCLDVIEVDAASNRRIDEVRQLRERVHFTPSEARFKVYIIDEVHMLTTEASNALLKTLEEPPKHVIFILATTEPHKVLPTILSRCQHFMFRRLSHEAIVSRLSYIAEQEGLSVDREALSLIARNASGSLRDAENLLEQMVNYFGRNIALEDVRSLLGVDVDTFSREIVGNLLEGRLTDCLETLHRALDEGKDIQILSRGITNYLRNLLLIKTGAAKAVEATPEEVEQMKEIARRVSIQRLLRIVKSFSQLDLRQDNLSPLPLELAVVESLVESGREPDRFERGEALRAMERGEEEKAAVRSEPAPASVGTSRQEAGGGDSQLTLETISRRWREFVNSLRGKGSRGDLDARLRSACQPIGLDGDVLELGFKYQSHLEKIRDPKYQHLVEMGLKEFFGKPLKLKLTLLSSSRPVTQEPLVKAALESGARIINKEER